MARRTLTFVLLVSVAVGAILTVGYGLRHAPEQDSGNAYFWWTILAAPALGAVSGWAGWAQNVRGDRLRVAARVAFGAALGLLLSDAAAAEASRHTACFDPSSSGECGFGLFVVGLLGVGVAAALAAGGVVLLGVARLRGDRIRGSARRDARL